MRIEVSISELQFIELCKACENIDITTEKFLGNYVKDSLGVPRDTESQN